MKRNEVLYLVSERQLIVEDEFAAQPGLVLVTEEAFPTTAPTVDAIVQAMRKKANGSGRIKLLSVQCHGGAGKIQLWGGGVATANSAQSTTTTAKSEIIVWDNVYKLAPFADCLAADGRVELHACNVAAASASAFWSNPGGGCGDNARRPSPNTSNTGASFLQSLANVLGVPVTAGVHVQVQMIGFDGSTVTAYPMSS